MNSNNFMNRIAGFIVKFRWLFVLIFAALVAFSFVSIPWIQVENDITAYLPDEAEARRGLSIMEDEFSTFATAQVDALTYLGKQRIGNNATEFHESNTVITEQAADLSQQSRTLGAVTAVVNQHFRATVMTNQCGKPLLRLPTKHHLCRGIEIKVSHIAVYFS